MLRVQGSIASRSKVKCSLVQMFVCSIVRLFNCSNVQLFNCSIFLFSISYFLSPAIPSNFKSHFTQTSA
jgi:hypothetical protein